MADFGSFFDPANAAAVLPQTDALKERWDLYLNDPKTQAALLSFGGQMAQPMQWGQSGFGHLMSSVGQGGASVRQTEELDRKQQETDSKADLREAQGLLAETRAGTATANSNTAAARLETARMREEGLTERSRLSRLLQANSLYAEYVKSTQKFNENESLMRGRNAQTRPILSRDEWFSQNQPLMTSLGLTPDSFRPPAPGGGGNDPTVLPPSGASPAPATTPPPSGTGAPRPGQVIDGWRFKGGNPRDRNNWERVSG